MKTPPEPGKSTDKRYWAFISYSHADSKEAEWLHKSLEGFKVPPSLVGTESRNGVVPRRIFPVFRDRDELPTSADLGANLHAALRNARYLIVICSPSSANSMWVNAEVEFFKKTHGNSNVLCLIIGGTPGGTGEGEQAECFCPALRHQINPDGSTGAPSEPIAADLRDNKDGRLRALLKIVAGILGVDFDALYQREKRRKRKRALALAAAAAGLAAIGLLFYQRLDSVAKSQSEVASEVKRMREMKFRAFGELPEERAQALGKIIDDSGVLTAEESLAKALASEEQRFGRYKERLNEFIDRRKALVSRVEALIDSVRPTQGWAAAARVLSFLQDNSGMHEETSVALLDSQFKMAMSSRNFMRPSPYMIEEADNWETALQISAPFLEHSDEAQQLTANMTSISYILPPDFEVGSTEPQPGRDFRVEHADKLNSAAWLLATDPDPSLRDPAKALAFALKAARLTAEKDPRILDTLAAAHAASGDFASALRWQTLAVERGSSASAGERAGFLDRFRLYEADKAYLEEDSHTMEFEDVTLCVATPEGLDAWASDQRDNLEALESALAQFPSTPEEKVVVDTELQRLKDSQSQLESDGSRQLNDMRKTYKQATSKALASLGGEGYTPLPELDGLVTASERIWRKPADAPERGSLREGVNTIVENGVTRQIVRVDKEGSVELYCISRFVFADSGSRDLNVQAIAVARDFARSAAQFLGVHLP
jgi:hypothetical protein